ncbi:MAG: 4'-phosphopantetheinyl transferase superfamily protein [Clostridia bacterium]|nr:4'-phosphopantetheinyl transferase superfamily protein [Clostridia bacterium]
MCAKNTNTSAPAPDTLVIVSAVKQELIKEVYPKERQQEIESSLNSNVKLQKYYAWQTLKRAVEKFTKKSFKEFTFVKESSGKWVSDNFYFSITHSENAVAVAISNQAVGIDLQTIKPLKAGLEDKILCKEEMDIFNALEENKKEQFLLKCWCKKEAMLKQKGESTLAPKSRNTLDACFFEKELAILNKEYYLCVLTEQKEIQLIVESK